MRAGTEKVCPPSRLTAAYTSVEVPSAVEADQATTTKDPRAAIETLPFARPGTPSVVGPAAWGIVGAQHNKRHASIGIRLFTSSTLRAEWRAKANPGAGSTSHDGVES
jgi:hypothetical protein